MTCSNHIRRFVILALCAAASNLAAADNPRPSGAFQRGAIIHGVQTVHVNLDLLAPPAKGAPTTTFEDFPAGPNINLMLELQQFHVTGPDTLFKLGRLDGPDLDLNFDASQVVLLRGSIPASAGSDIFMALSPYGSTGWIDMGPGRTRFGLSSVGPGGVRLPPGQLAVFPALGPAVSRPAVEFCAFDHDHEGEREPIPLGFPDDDIDGGQRGSGPVKGRQQIELAIDTDYECFARFGNALEAAAYIVTLYAADSSIYMREVNSEFKLTYVRIWDNPVDLFNDPDPLEQFVDYWRDNMGSVPRDVVQFFSGRRDLPYGGVAYVGALCSINSGYSVAGYAVGSFATPDAPSTYNQDIEVTSHELGHNCGAQHTDFYGIDICSEPNTPPRRGTIMSYCSQTVSGGTALMDMYFHRLVRNAMRSHIVSRSCIADDCNRNGVLDSTDIQQGVSVDLNANGIPDECEDCNGNSVLDTADIAGGTSLDQNTNGIPDECEPDCNGNGVPDTLDISRGTSIDAYGNSIPDECEEDCNNNSVSDYTEIMLNMSLDLDRNAVLDSCQNCDQDAQTDMQELGAANNVWVVSTADATGLGEFYSRTGVRVRTASGGQLQNGQDVLVAPDGHVLVSSANNDRVLEYSQTGVYVRNFVTTGSGGLNFPAGLAFAPNGNLLVCSKLSNSVLEYNQSTGAFVRQFVAAGSGGLTAPFGLTFGPTGNLFVTSGDNRVMEYDRNTGAFVRVLVTAGGNGGLSDPRGLVFKPDGKLLVASYQTNQLLEYNGQTGAFIRQFNSGGTSSVLFLDGPFGVRMGPDGNVYASRNRFPRLHVTTTRIFVFEVDTGFYLRSLIQGNDTNLYSTAGFDFVPNLGRDCNLNLTPDSCDIAQGYSRDCNANGAPDECEAPPACDTNCDGSVNLFDIQGFVNALSTQSGCSPCAGDTNQDGSINLFDIQSFVACISD